MLDDHTQGGGNGDKGRCEAVGDGRDTSSRQRIFAGQLVQTKRLFWNIIYQRLLLLLLISSVCPWLWLAEEEKKEKEVTERWKRVCTDRISPVVNSKVNTEERERKEVYLCHTDSRWDACRCPWMYKRLVPEFWQGWRSSPKRCWLQL